MPELPPLLDGLGDCECLAAPEPLENTPWFRRWEIESVLPPVDSRADFIRETRQLRRLQDRLIACLAPGETLSFRFQRGARGRTVWSVALAFENPDGMHALPTADAVSTTLRICEDRLRFQETSAPHREPRGRLLELRPVTGPVSCPRSSLGFGAEDAESIELPFILSGIQGMTFPDLVMDNPDIVVAEILVSPWVAPADWRETCKRILRVTTEADPAGPGHAVLERLQGVQRRGGFTLRCRFRLAPGRSDSALDRLFGPCLFHAHAILGKPSKGKPGGFLQGEVLPGHELPLFLPMAGPLEDRGYPRRFNRWVPPLPARGLIVGDVENKPLRLPEEGRCFHTYIVGSTGTGKSTLLFNMIEADMQAGAGVILLDPHGDLYDQVHAAVPARRRKDVHVIDPLATVPPPGINLLEVEPGNLRDMRMSFVIGELFRIIEDLYNMREVGGPMFEMYFRNAIKLMMKTAAQPQPTLLDFARVFVDRAYRHSLMAKCPDERVIQFWTNQAEKVTGEARMENIAPYVSSKLDGFSNSGFISQIIGQAKTTLQMGEIMAKGKILLVNLSKGLLGGAESRLLGMALMTQVFSAALERATIPKRKRVPCHLYVDEFQNFVTDSVAFMMSESRKFGLHLTLANQTLAQLRANPGRQNVLEAVLGNAGNLIAFRLGISDAELLAPFTVPYTPAQMQRMPNYHAFARVLTAEGPVNPVIMRTRPGANS